MSATTVYSAKRNRVFIRAFDYDEARRRHAGGESYASIAQSFGVSSTAVARAVNDATRARMDAAAAKKVMSGACVDCGKACALYHHVHPEPRCHRCAHIAYLATSVRPDTLQCLMCREWKPDNSFPRSAPLFARRGRHKYCTPCGTISKRDYRRRKREQGLSA